jgi:hypothetical protein
MLKMSSLEAKAGAVAALAIQLNYEAENDIRSILEDLEVPDNLVQQWKKHLAAGFRLIPDCDNLLQLASRFQCPCERQRVGELSEASGLPVPSRPHTTGCD